ncbi:MAG: HNH endonuclease signature motif containing protein [Candidatus Methanomethylicaceae archaeon]
MYRWGKYGACSNRNVEELDVHHIHTRGAGGDDDPMNLITLCRRHHDMAGTGLISKAELYIILSELYEDIGGDDEEIY